jgi:hypothetical protein
VNGLTATEERLVERYAAVLDYLSRCAQAIDAGNWHYLNDKARQLLGATQKLAAAANDAEQAAHRRRPPRREEVRVAVAYSGHHYRAGRLLHPIDPKGRG